ncbi:hypothetical protein [Bacillus sp. JCM 19041]|uniref:BclA C-terminal domain-containing protein n=1 Tax=Bacillus sp. JCM 19041 TaxID=1460637 RepID=UPI0006D11F2F
MDAPTGTPGASADFELMLAGITGPTGASLTSTNAFCINGGTTIAVLLVNDSASTSEPSGVGITPTASGFTINTAGTYSISYGVNLTAVLLLGLQLTVNGTPLTASQVRQE